MADQIAGMPKKYVLIGGAAAAGILGYAYWKNGSAGPVESAGVGEPIEAAADEYESPLGNSGGNSTGAYPGNVDPDKIDTNSEWTQAAVESLESSGWERAAVLTALGKYLAFKPLSASEVTIVMAARAVQGEPPVGGPFPIKDALPSSPIPLPSVKTLAVPTGVKITATGPTSARIDWNNVSGATGYRIGLNGKYYETVYTSSIALRGLKRNTSYSVKIQARNSGSTYGPAATITVKTKAK